MGALFSDDRWFLSGPFTAFVPKQDVLDNLPQEILDMLLNDVELLTKVWSVPGFITNKISTCKFFAHFYETVAQT